MCRNEGEGCGVHSTGEKMKWKNKKMKLKTMKYMNPGKCCDGLICEKSSPKQIGPPGSPQPGEFGGKCVKGIFSVILVHIHSKIMCILRFAILA